MVVAFILNHWSAPHFLIGAGSIQLLLDCAPEFRTEAKREFSQIPVLRASCSLSVAHQLPMGVPAGAPVDVNRKAARSRRCPPSSTRPSPACRRFSPCLWRDLLVPHEELTQGLASAEGDKLSFASEFLDDCTALVPVGPRPRLGVRRVACRGGGRDNVRRRGALGGL